MLKRVQLFNAHDSQEPHVSMCSCFMLSFRLLYSFFFHGTFVLVTRVPIEMKREDMSRVFYDACVAYTLFDRATSRPGVMRVRDHTSATYVPFSSPTFLYVL